ncbi:alpha-2,3-sialyltransferase, partial [Campylobacter jejuni subsp. jejuni]
YTRPDIMFFKPLRLDEYIKVYNPVRKPQNGWEGVFREFPLPPKTNFCSSNAFRVGLLDSRMPNEGDLVWFSNFGLVKHPHKAYLEDESIYNIFIKYRWGYEFRPWRSGMQQINQYMFVDIKKSDLDALNQKILILNEEKLSFQKSLDSLPIKKQNMELICLEQDIEIKDLQLYQLRKKIGLNHKDNVIY